MNAHPSLSSPAGEQQNGLLDILRQSTPACLVWVDAQGKVRFVTSACQTLFKHQLPGEFLSTLCRATNPSCLLKDPHRFAEATEHSSVFPYQTPEGKTCWVAHACRAHYDAQGQFQGRIGIFVDLTSQHESETRARRISEQFQQLYQILEALNRAETPQEVYDIAVESIPNLIQANSAAVLLFDAEGVPRFVAARGLSPAYQQKVEGHSPWPPTAVHAKPLWYEDVQHEDFSPDLQAAFREENIHALAFIPLLGGNRLLGKLMVYYHTPHTFSESEQQIIRVLASDIAAAILRVQAHEALKESETRFRALAESTPAAVYMIEKGRFTYTNPAFHRLSGYSPEDLRDLHYWEILEPESQALARERARRRMAGQTVQEYAEVLVRRKDGERRWALAGDSVVALGNRIVVVGSAVDITPLKQTEAALRESEARYRDLVENLRDGVGLHDLEGRLLASNPTVPHLLGHETLPEEPVYIPDLLAPEVRHEFDDYIRELRENGVAEGLMLVQMPLTGEKRLWEYHSTLRTSDGEPPVVRFYIRDVTEREKAYHALRESEARFRALAESTVAGIYVLVDNHFAYANPALSQLTGYTAEELRAMTPWEIIHPDFRETVRTNSQARLRGEDAPSPYEFQIITKSGEARWVLLGARRITWQDRPALMGSVVDITSQKHYQHALEAEIRIAQAFGKIPEEDLQSLAVHIVEAVYDLLPSAERVLLTLSTEENHLCVEAEQGNAPRLQGQCFPCEEALQEMRHHRHPFYLSETPAGFTNACTAHMALTPQAAVVPFVVGEEVIGALVLDGNPNKPPFNTEDLRLLEHFANTATLLLQHARLVANLKRRLQELETVHRLTLALRETLDTRAALEVLLDETLAVVNSDVGAILLHHAEDNRLKPLVARGWMQHIDFQPRAGEGIAGQVFAHNQPLFSNDLAQEDAPAFSANEHLPAGWGGACLPLRTPDKTLGVLFIGLPPNQHWTESRRHLLETLAELGSITLHRLGLLAETRHRLQQLQSLQVIAQAITGSLDLQLTLNILLEQVQTQFRPDAVDVMLVDTHLFSLSVMAATGFLSPESARRQVNMNGSLPGQVVLQGAPIVLNDLVTAIALHEGCRTFLESEGIRTYIGIPLVAKGQTKGVLELFFRTPTRLTAEQIDFLTHLGRHAAIALDNAQMVESLQKSTNELRAAYEATIEGWARALELRDQETEGHAQRVAALTVALARRLGVPEERLPHIRRGALLHDIGKMGVPDHILKKPGPLDAHEWEIMRQHPLWAYDMLKDIPYLQPALAIPLFHHERWDGSGYPSGLAGTAIPLAARIFAVVDVYDALTSDRPYRPAWSKEKALTYLKEQRGKLFDPRVVDAFLEMMQADQPPAEANEPSPSP